jgi:hypothetical protein
MAVVRHTLFSMGEGRAPLLVCAARVSHPQTRSDAVGSVCVWSRHRVGTLLNVAAGEVIADAPLLALYDALGIAYHCMALKDDQDATLLPATLAADVASLYAEHERAHGAARAFMINCRMGQNRSALAAALLLWWARPNQWSDARALISFMRAEQRAQRVGDSVATLTNYTFVQHLLAHCNNDGGGVTASPTQLLD